VPKALVVERTGKLPPRLHSLPRLAEAAGLKPDADTVDFLAEITAYYIESRYPERIEALGRDVSAGTAVAALSRTDEVFQWLNSMLR
jgi:HEPN domain-containing protein